MSYVDWKIKGPKIGGCSCDYGCPCEFNGRPTLDNLCEGMEAMLIEEGWFGDVRLDGLKVGARFRWPGAVHEGGGTAQGFIDKNASEAQVEALFKILSGEEQEPTTLFNIYGSTIETELDPIFADIEFECDIRARTGRFVVDGVVKFVAEPIRNPITGLEHFAQIVLPNGFEFRKAEMASARFVSRGDSMEMDRDKRYAALFYASYGPQGDHSGRDGRGDGRPRQLTRPAMASPEPTRDGLSRAVEAGLARDRLVMLAGLVALTVLAWTYVLSGAGTGMSVRAMSTWSFPPPMRPSMAMDWSAGYWVVMFFMWWIMMIAMITPSAAPMVLLHARVSRHAQAKGRMAVAPVPTAVFYLGYLGGWAGFSLVAVVLQWTLERVGLVHGMQMWSSDRYLSAGFLVAAGIYQLSALKHICLEHCRSPAAYLSRHWRAGARVRCAWGRSTAPTASAAAGR